MVGVLQPLDEKFAIVGPDGKPTLYFIKWAQQRQLDISDGLTLQDLIDYLTAHLLQEGSGIQFTPNGEIPNSPTIAADVQEILDQVSATRGTILYRGLLGWSALLPGTAGFFLKTNGAGADPAWAAGGGGGGNWWVGHTPLAADFPVNFGTVAPTKTDDPNIGLVIDGGAPITGDVSRIAARVITTPAADWTVTMRADLTAGPDAYNGTSLCLVDSVANRVIHFGKRPGDYVFGITRMSIPSGWNSNTKSSALIGTPKWLRIARVGTNNVFSYSEDGKNYAVFLTESATLWLTNNANHVGLGIAYNRAGGNNNYIACDYWVQSW